MLFLTPNVNTGDAGELVTASYYLGTAHPSGYPLYLLIAKAFTFLPLGNMAFKVALVSAVFSSLVLTLIYWLVFRLTSSNTASAFTTVLLLTSYSFFTQSVIAKFYPLNLFLVISLFSIWILQLLKKTPGSEKPDLNLINNVPALCLTSFLSGLIISNHHTGILMFGPVIVASLLCRKDLIPSIHGKVRSMVTTMAVLFFSGIIVNAYLLLRGGDNHIFNVFYVRDLTEFFRLISRDVYGEGSTINIAGNAATARLSNWTSSWHGLRKFISVAALNFGLFSLLLFFSGCFFLLKKNYKILIFSLITLFVYGPFLAMLALSSPDMTPFEYYVAGQQYFLPAYAIYAMFIGVGFFQITLWLRLSTFKFARKALPVIITVFFVGLLSIRSADSNYRTNYVPYQTAKDTYSIMPVNSVFLALGDNERFQGRYIKLIGRYREDVCHLNAVTLQFAVRGLSGCRDASYSSISPETFIREFGEIKAFMTEKRFYSDALASEYPPLEEYATERKFSLIHLYLPGGNGTGDDSSAFLSKSLLLADRLINHNACSTQRTDDMFTRYLCEKYDAHFLGLIDFYTAKLQTKSTATSE